MTDHPKLSGEDTTVSGRPFASLGQPAGALRAEPLSGVSGEAAHQAQERIDRLARSLSTMVELVVSLRPKGKFEEEIAEARAALSATPEQGDVNRIRAEAFEEAAQALDRRAREAARTVHEFDSYNGPELSGRKQAKALEQAARSHAEMIRALAPMPPAPKDEGDDETCTGCHGTGFDANREARCHCQPVALPAEAAQQEGVSK